MSKRLNGSTDFVERRLPLTYFTPIYKRGRILHVTYYPRTLTPNSRLCRFPAFFVITQVWLSQVVDDIKRPTAFTASWPLNVTDGHNNCDNFTDNSYEESCRINLCKFLTGREHRAVSLHSWSFVVVISHFRDVQTEHQEHHTAI